MKSLISLVFAFSLLISLNVFAQAINSEFKPSQEIFNIKEGDLIEATLRFWPIENADLEQFKKLEKTVFFNAFYMAQILNLELSPNNADVVELKALFIVKSAKPQNIFVFNYNETPIEMKIEGVKIEELKNKDQDYFIMNQSLNGSHLLLILSTIFAILIAVAIYKRNNIIEFIAGLRPDADKKARMKYDALFRVANQREEFELIYKEKEIWLKLLESKAPAHNEFFKILNQYQFKKNWSNEDYVEVRAAFDVIRRSFSK